MGIAPLQFNSGIQGVYELRQRIFEPLLEKLAHEI